MKCLGGSPVPRDEELSADSLNTLCCEKRKLMASETTRKLFKVDDLYRMDEAGIFTNERVELINGEIFLMTIGSRHAARVERARDLFTRAFSGKAAVRSQNPAPLDGSAIYLVE